MIATMDKVSGWRRVSVGRFLAGNAVAASAFMLTYAVSLLPSAISADLTACKGCARQEQIEMVAGRLEGLGVALLLTPFVFLIMLPITLILLPLVRFVLVRVCRRWAIVALGGLVGATLGVPIFALTYPADIHQMTATIVTTWLTLLLPSMAAGAAFAGTLVVASGRRTE